MRNWVHTLQKLIEFINHDVINESKITNKIFFFYFQNQLIRAASTPSNANNDDNDEGSVEIRKKETDEVQRRDGALNQFISELSSNIHGRRYSEAPNATNNKNNNSSSTSSNQVESKQQTAVESSTDSNDKKVEQNSTIEATDKVSDNSTAGESERKKNTELLTQPSHFVTVIEVKESSSASSPETAITTTVAATTITSSITTTTTTSSTSSFRAIRSGYENVIIENNKRNSNLISEMDRNSNTTSFNSVRPSAPAIALLQDSKKKIPPRWVIHSFIY